MKNLIRKFFVNYDRKLYNDNKFVVVSNNCWGAEVYKRLGVQYNTPFVGLFIFGPDYLKLLSNFDYYLNSKLSFISKSKWIDKPLDYPVGFLVDVEIHFLHYKNKKEASLKWNRRVVRMLETKNKNNYFFKICDRDLTDNEILLKFHQLPFKNKISFGLKNLEIKNHIKVKENQNNSTVPDGLKLFRCSFRYIDIFKWIDSGILTNSYYNRLKYFLKVI
ncbi:DUF1919 domain-containing protein [Aquimarina agarivorans]|uniref:DUF1919 domain-containing protein n=1 Tax=Aquimarina agarivorans TaxID=980584 RepID=UPI000248FC6F|nr:DUF1919 domain-containing protein [Aquimarina agarivorans]